MRTNILSVFLQNRALYEETARRYVCEKCVDRGEDGSCYSRDPQGCAVFRYLPELVRIALKLHDRKIGPYAEAVRLRICSQCKNSEGAGHCELRDNIDCGLNRYLPLVLDAVEEVDKKLGLA